MNLYENIENERKEVIKKRNKFRLIAIPLIILGIVMLFVLPPIGILAFIAGIIIVAISESKVSTFKNGFKDSIVKKLLSEELGEHIYNPHTGIPLNEIISVGIYENPDRYHLEDFVSSTYNGIKYEMCDAQFEEKYYVTVDGKQQVRYRTYFKGRIIKLDYNKRLNTTIKIIEGRPQGLNVRCLTKVETESIEFNKKYDTYTSNKEDVYYYITPLMIQKLLELEKLFKGTIQYSITPDAMYIFINNDGDSLEVNINKPVNEEQISILRSQILLPSSIINELNLDKTKFNKEIDL